jgi:Uncharacterized protein conserved in bacteria
MKFTFINIPLLAFAICSFGFCFIKTKNVLSAYNFKSNSCCLIKLGSELSEISGIAFTNDNRLFAHHDEYGIIYQIDTKNGNILKKFWLGRKAIKGDFEDLTIIKNKFYLLKSNGKIFEFNEGNNNSSTNYIELKTGLKKINNVEGLTYNPKTNSLLLACKDFPGKDYEGFRAVYSYSLSTNKLESKPIFLIPVSQIISALNIDDFRPSAICRCKNNGHYIILSASSRAVIEVSENGKILEMQKLSKKHHPKPEGIAVDNMSRLIISDEADQGGTLTFYSPAK